MRRPAYVCATCSEHFTRRYSAARHNLTIHKGIGEIVTYLEYLVGRNSGRYRPSHPSLYRKRRREKGNRDSRYATTVAADSMGDTFPPGVLQGQYYRHYPQHQQQAPSGPIPLPSLPQPSAQDVSQYSPDQIIRPVESTKDEGTLSEETMLKIQGLRRLMYKYPQYHSNPDVILKCATHFSINGDNTLLDEWLERFHTLDAISKY
jgi:hypothetical protein